MKKCIILFLFSAIFNFAQNKTLEKILDIPWGSSKQYVMERMYTIGDVIQEKYDVVSYGGKFKNWKVYSWTFRFAPGKKLFYVGIRIKDEKSIYDQIISFYKEKYGEPKTTRLPETKWEPAMDVLTWDIDTKKFIGINMYKNLSELTIGYFDNTFME